MIGTRLRLKGLLLVLVLSSPVMTMAALVPFVQQFETREAVKVRSAPDTGANLLARLPAGSQLRSKKRSADGRWIQVKLQQLAVTGYVRTRHLQRRSTASKTDSRIELPADQWPSKHKKDPLAEVIRKKSVASLDSSSSVMTKVALVPFVQRFETRAVVKVRSAPDTGADVVARLPEGSRLRSKKRSNDGRWIQVKLQQPAVTGYVRTRHLQRRSTASRTDSHIELPADQWPSNHKKDPLAEVIKKTDTTSLDLGELAHSGRIEMQHLENARERQRQRELAEQRRQARRLKRAHREAEEAREQERELAEQRRRRQEGAALQETSSDVDWWSVAYEVVQSTAEINSIQQENAARTRQLVEQARREQQRQQEYGQQQQEQRQREQWQRQQIAAQQRRQQEQHQAEQQRRRAAQKLLAETTGAASSASGYSGGGGVSSSHSSGTAPSTDAEEESLSRKKQKVYEPMPVVMSRENFTWWSDRDAAIANARLKAMNAVRDRAHEKGARVDSFSFKQIKQGDTPGRWSFANPDCRQNSNGKWKCSAEVRTHPYRMQ